MSVSRRLAAEAFGKAFARDGLAVSLRPVTSRPEETRRVYSCASFGEASPAARGSERTRVRAGARFLLLTMSLVSPVRGLPVQPSIERLYRVEISTVEPLVRATAFPRATRPEV